MAKFNGFVTRRLLDGCLKELFKHGVRKSDITIARVPGSLEIPLVALRLAKRKNIQAVICLGAVIRGETLHFDLVAKGAAWESPTPRLLQASRSFSVFWPPKQSSRRINVPMRRKTIRDVMPRSMPWR